MGRTADAFWLQAFRGAETRRATGKRSADRHARRASRILRAGSAAGRAILYFHGGPGGHDQLHLLNRLATQGYRLIGWSQPGYLRTPLEVGRTFAEQADAAVALLDELGLHTVVAYGISGGGPPAIELARRHPSRVDALVLESAISRHYAPAVSKLVSRTYLSPYGTWLVTTLANRLPRTAVADFVRQESTLDRQARRGLVEWIASDSRRMALVRTVLASLTPYEDRAAGLENPRGDLLDACPARLPRR